MNCEGSYKRSVTIGMVISWGNLVSLLGSGGESERDGGTEGRRTRMYFDGEKQDPSPFLVLTWTSRTVL